MLRVQYYIGNKTCEEICASLYRDEDVSPSDVFVATTSASWGSSGNDVIMLSKTPAGDAFLTFMILKYSQYKDFVMDEIPNAV
jgi:hypothetical protein